MRILVHSLLLPMAVFTAHLRIMGQHELLMITMEEDSQVLQLLQAFLTCLSKRSIGQLSTDIGEELLWRGFGWTLLP